MFLTRRCAAAALAGTLAASGAAAQDEQIVQSRSMRGHPGPAVCRHLDESGSHRRGSADPRRRRQRLRRRRGRAAVLALVEPQSNGIGSDAVISLDAKSKQVFSINAEGMAPKLATIDWYQKNNGGKLPDSDRPSASTPRVVDAWYAARSMGAEHLPSAAAGHRRRGQGFPASESLARSIAGSKEIQVSTTKKSTSPTARSGAAQDLQESRRCADV